MNKDWRRKSSVCGVDHFEKTLQSLYGHILCRGDSHSCHIFSEEGTQLFYGHTLFVGVAVVLRSCPLRGTWGSVV